MKFLSKLFLFLIPLTAALAAAQINYPTAIKNVIVVVQENRTPDNLFQDQNLINAGADIVQSGLCGNANQPLGARTLMDCAGPGHTHQPDWINSWDGGQVPPDGAYEVNMAYNPGSCQKFTCNQNSKGKSDCTMYAYVSDSDQVIQPYWDIAEAYGFANYMFQASQGPSFPAHQFIFGGSSAPGSVELGDQYYKYFAAENPTDGAGCIANSTSTVAVVDTTGAESIQAYPCFSRPTLATLLDSNQIPWGYYSDGPTSAWNAPNAISNICPYNPGGSCSSPDWKNYVQNNIEGSLRAGNPTLAPFLYDLEYCNFPSTSGGVYFVTPDARWGTTRG